ncbi:hypothetical protein [Massilia suwonensis]|uniref:Uncharacterized protein n=1 Tax=Massilia suwonensis TaxID=648895 RepID=A0ABW0MU07_9BURK
MNPNIYRFAGVFVALLGLAYLGHQVFVRGGAAPQSQAPMQQAQVQNHGADAGAVAPVVSSNAYVVYPDKATDAALGLSYSSFSGDFVHNVTMTPMPPNAAGRTILRIASQKGTTLTIGLKDTRCASPVHVVVSKIDTKQPVETRELTPTATKFSMPFAEQWLPHMLIEVRMDDKAQNNYYCGVAVDWS